MPEDDHELTEEDRADLAALADGSLDRRRQRAVEARVAVSPVLRAGLERQRAALAAVRAAAAQDRAPGALRERLRAADPEGVAPVARRRRRPPLVRTPTVVALGAACAAFAVGATVLVTDAERDARPPSLAAVAALAARPAEGPAPAEQGSLLAASADGVDFPNWRPRLGWRATGVREDRLGGRRAVTVFYERDGRTFAYAIVSRPALRLPPGRGRYRTVRDAGVPAVAWVRGGRTCVLAGDLPEAMLRRLASSTRFY